jgi:hypothetical protein
VRREQHAGHAMQQGTPEGAQRAARRDRAASCPLGPRRREHGRATPGLHCAAKSTGAPRQDHATPQGTRAANAPRRAAPCRGCEEVARVGATRHAAGNARGLRALKTPRKGGERRTRGLFYLDGRRRGPRGAPIGDSVFLRGVKRDRSFGLNRGERRPVSLD